MIEIKVEQIGTLLSQASIELTPEEAQQAIAAFGFLIIHSDTDDIPKQFVHGILLLHTFINNLDLMVAQKKGN